MEILDERVSKKREIYEIYKEGFKDIPVKMMEELPETICTHWLSTMTIENDVHPMDIINALSAENIESRPVWKPMHLQPIYKNCKFFTHLDNGSYSEFLFNKGICLPSDSKMTEEQQRKVIDTIKSCFVK